MSLRLCTCIFRSCIFNCSFPVNRRF